MKLKNTVLALLALSWLGQANSDEIGGPPTSNQLTLKQCVDLAAHQSEQLQMSAEDIIQAREHIRQATAGILPTIEWNWTHLIQDSDNESASGSDTNSSQSRRRTDSKFSARQPLFYGFREFSARSAFKAQTEKEKFEYTREKVELIGLTAESFFLVVLAETERKNLLTLIKLTQDRIKELDGRVNLGKSRNSEVISAESQLASLQADLANTDAQIAVSRDNLGFLVGQDVSNTLLVDVMPAPNPMEDDKNLIIFINNRSDIKALQETVIARRYGVRVARSGFSPRADVSGNYYTQRPGSKENIDWDVLFNVDVPLFQGGEVVSLSREASSLLRQAELDLERLTRQVGSEIRQARVNLNSAISQSKILEVAFDKSRQSYQLQVREYRLGLVNNLDVLQAMNTMQAAKERLDQAQLQSKLNWLRLQIALEQKL